MQMQRCVPYSCKLLLIIGYLTWLEHAPNEVLCQIMYVHTIIEHTANVPVDAGESSSVDTCINLMFLSGWNHAPSFSMFWTSR